jgi:hypothetical protein
MKYRGRLAILERPLGPDTSNAIVIGVRVDIGETKEAALARVLVRRGLFKDALSTVVFTGREIGFQTEIYKPGARAH